MTDRPQLYRLPYPRRVLSVATDALIGYWPLSEPSGAAAINQSNNRFHGVYTGVELNYPGIGDGLACPLWDGVNDYCNIYSAAFASAFNNQEGTAHIWLKVASGGTWTDSTLRRAMILQADSNNRVRLEKTTSNGRVDVVYSAGGTSKSVAITGLSSLDWHQVVITWSKSADQVKAYLNGVQTGATQTALGTWAGALGSTTTVIGAGSTAPVNAWSGYLAHAAVWTRALTAGEIAELYRVT